MNYLIVPQASETPTSHHQWPPNMEAVTSEASIMHYKMDPDAAHTAHMSTMYYPPVHQVSHNHTKDFQQVYIHSKHWKN